MLLLFVSWAQRSIGMVQFSLDTADNFGGNGFGNVLRENTNAISVFYQNLQINNTIN